MSGHPKELLATAIGWRGRHAVERAESVLERLGGVRGFLVATEADLVASGLTCMQAKRVRAALGLAVPPVAEPVGIRTVEDVVNVVVELKHELDEVLAVLSLNQRRELLDRRIVTRGNSRFTIVDPVQVYRIALVHRAAAIVLVHNHPSGDPTPSKEDFEVTKRVEAAGRVLGIELLNHVVIARHGYVSLAHEGAISRTHQAVSWAA